MDFLKDACDGSSVEVVDLQAEYFPETLVKEKKPAGIQGIVVNGILRLIH